MPATETREQTLPTWPRCLMCGRTLIWCSVPMRPAYRCACGASYDASLTTTRGGPQ